MKDFYEFKENCTKVQELLLKEYGSKEELEESEVNDSFEEILDNIKEDELSNELPNQLIEYTIEILSSKEEDTYTTKSESLKKSKPKAKGDGKNEPKNSPCFTMLCSHFNKPFYLLNQIVWQ